MSRINGVVVGIVKSLDDPRNEGRIQVDFEWSLGKNRSFWAPVATLMAGSKRGSWFMPEIDDEVLVAFDHGDVNYPYIIGFLWNGKDKPPETDKSIRKIKTKSGHIIEFNDNTGQEKVTIRSQLGQEIVIDDTATKIHFKSKLGQEIIIDDKAMKVIIKAPVQLEVKTLLARFSGILEAKMIRTEAIQSKVYSPGVGNIH